MVCHDSTRIRVQRRQQPGGTQPSTTQPARGRPWREYVSGYVRLCEPNGAAYICDAPVAQGIERLPPEQKAAGSNPAGGTTFEMQFSALEPPPCDPRAIQFLGTTSRHVTE